MFETFIDIRFQRPTLAVIDRVNEVITEYAAKGFTLTLRQLYYQFVAHAWIANTQKEYKKLGRVVTDGRRAGRIDWDAIEDRTRFVRRLPTWGEPSDIIDTCATRYKEDIWASQPYRPEVWIEKDALTGVIQGVCNELRAPWFSCRGNISESEMYAAGKRFAEIRERGQTPMVLHLGDHDPNGIDMTRDIRDRLEMFARGLIQVHRLALNLDQTDGLPPSPAKQEDSRYAAYVKEFGVDDCWELDALSPDVIEDLVRSELEALIDRSAWDAALGEERDNRDILGGLSRNWSKVKKLLSDEA